MDLTVAICVHNGEDTLGEQLDALFNQEWPESSELLLVDNLSTDRTREVLEAHARPVPPCRVVAARQKADLAYARNVAVQSAASENIAFCDADDRVGPGWVMAMHRGLSAGSLVTGPLELDALNPPWLAASRGRRTETGRFDFYGIFSYVSGCNMGVRRELWARVGGFREGFVPEDMEFSFRAWRSGATVDVEPNAMVHYRYRSLARPLYRQGFAYGAGRVAIARMLRESGLQRPPPLAGWRSWLWLLAHPPVAGAQARAVWSWVAGNRMGHLAGSIRSRTILL